MTLSQLRNRINALQAEAEHERNLDRKQDLLDEIDRCWDEIEEREEHPDFEDALLEAEYRYCE